MFLANYADMLTDAPLDEMIDRVRAQRRGRPACSRCRRCRRTTWSRSTTTAGHRRPRVRRPAAVGERRLLRAAAGDLRRPARGRGPGAARARRGCSPTGELLAQPLHGLLAGGRHVQGPRRAGGDVPSVDRARGCSGSRRPRRHRDRADAGASMPRLTRPRPATCARSVGRRRSAPIPTTSRSAPAACCCRWPAAVPDVRVHYVVLTGIAGTAGRGAGGRRPRSCPAPS